MTTLNALWVSAWMLTAPPSAVDGLPTPTDSVEMQVMIPVELSLNDSVSSATLEELSYHLRRFADDENRLGERRRRRLWVARSYLPRLDLGALPYDDPRVEEEVEEIIGHCVSKLLRSRLEEHVGLNGLRRRIDERRGVDNETGDVTRRWSLSPRVGVGHDPWLGSKLRWRTRGATPTWRRPDIALGVKRHLLHDELALRVELASENVDLQVEHIYESEFSGDMYRMSLRWRF